MSSDDEKEPPKINRRAIREAKRAPILAKKNADKEAGRTLVKGKKKPGGRPIGHDAKIVRERTDFVGKLLDRGATRQQAIDALMRPKSTDPSKPGGLGLTYTQCLSAWYRATNRRGEEFREESARARAEQCLRLRGHISAAAIDKQYGAVASLEREYGRVMGTDAPVRQAAPRGDSRELIAEVIAGMSPEEIRAMAGEDLPRVEEET